METEYSADAGVSRVGWVEDILRGLAQSKAVLNGLGLLI